LAGTRPVFGSVNSTAASGLWRKFDADADILRIAALQP